MFLDDGLPREERPRRSAQLDKPVRGRGYEDQQVLIQPGAGITLGDDALGQLDGGRVLVPSGVRGVGFKHNQVSAVVIVRHVTRSGSERVHGHEIAPVALGRDAVADLVVGVAIAVVGRGSVGRDPGDVRDQRVPVLRSVDVEVRGLIRKATQCVGELASGLARLDAAEHHRLHVDTAFAVRPWRRAHVHGSGRAPGCRQSAEVRERRVDAQRKRIGPVDVGLDDRVPAFLQVLLQLARDPGGIHGQVARHDQQ